MRFTYKSAALADRYSRCVPGSGHFYIGRYASGFVWFCLWIVALIPFLLPGLIMVRLCAYACVAMRRSAFVTTTAIVLALGCLAGDLYLYSFLHDHRPAQTLQTTVHRHLRQYAPEIDAAQPFVGMLPPRALHPSIPPIAIAVGVGIALFTVFRFLRFIVMALPFIAIAGVVLLLLRWFS